VVVLGNRGDPTAKHLFAVDLAGGEAQQLTTQPGAHTAVADHALRTCVVTYSAPDQPPTVRLCSLEDGCVLQTLFEPADPRLAVLDLRAPEMVYFTTAEGVTLYGALYQPDPEAGPGPYPLIVSVYGGPHAQLVTRSWSMTVDMRAQYLRSRGYLVLRLDNRGSARRGLAFEGAIKHALGGVEVQDQVAGVRWLVEQGLADPQRVGIYGWSYGGYIAAMCLAQAPETFRVAVAGAPVTHWDGYDTFYTERYMGAPASNPEGYRASSVMAHVDKIQGRLLLVHGLIDENVHFRHTARLINALIRAGKRYDLLLLPDARHSSRKLEDRIYVEGRVAAYFDEYLR
jgi:dipeptidyl-peptidase-4